MLLDHSDWMPLGSTDEQKEAKDGTVEAWAPSSGNPVGGWYGLKKCPRGRFANYVPPVMEALGLAEVEHNARKAGCAPSELRLQHDKGDRPKGDAI